MDAASAAERAGRLVSTPFAIAGSLWRQVRRLLGGGESAAAEAAATAGADWPQPYDFQQLRQAQTISDLRQSLRRVVTEADQLKQLIERETTHLRRRVRGMGQDDLKNPDELAAVLGEAISALIEIRDAARRFDPIAAGGDAPTGVRPASLPRPPADSSRPER